MVVFLEGIRNDFINRLTQFRIQNKFSVKQLKWGALFSFLGSILFTAIVFIYSLLASVTNLRYSFPITPFYISDVLYLVGFAFVFALVPVTICVFIMTNRIRKIDFEIGKSVNKFIIEGALLGAIFSLAIGLVVTGFYWISTVGTFHPPIWGFPIIFTLEAVVAGAIMGGLGSFYLKKWI